LALVAFAQADPKVAYRESGEGFRVGEKIRILDLADDSVTQFTDDWLREASPSWLPGGEALVANGYQDDHWSIFRARVGGERTWLTDHPASDVSPTVSPDGRRIAFASGRDGDMQLQLYVMNADGANLRRLTNDEFWSGTPSWSPDGTKLAYGYTDGWNFSTLRILDLDTGESRALTNRNGRRSQPQWSWDGRHIAYRVQDDALGESHVEVMTVDRTDSWRRRRTPALSTAGLRGRRTATSRSRRGAAIAGISPSRVCRAAISNCSPMTRRSRGGWHGTALGISPCGRCRSSNLRCGVG
jgi:Tol biopolymer transport system component